MARRPAGGTPSTAAFVAVAAVLVAAPGPDFAVVVRNALRGRPAKVLIEDSADANLLVRGHGGFGGLLLGSVSQHVAAYAKCPVTVVR